MVLPFSSIYFAEVWHRIEPALQTRTVDDFVKSDFRVWINVRWQGGPEIRSAM